MVDYNPSTGIDQEAGVVRDSANLFTRDFGRSLNSLSLKRTVVLQIRCFFTKG